MALSARQLRFYADLVDIYRPLPFNFLDNQDIEEYSVSTVATYSSVAVHRETKPEFTAAQPIGRGNQDILFSIDEFHFSTDVDIRPNDVFHFVTPSHPDYGQWFIAIGDTRVKKWKANKHSVLCKRILKVRQVAP